jgi:hypothetical protein
MSNDMAMTLLSLAFTVPAVGLLLVALMKRTVGGSDVENSSELLIDDDEVPESVQRSKLGRRLSAGSIIICIVLTASVTVVTLVVAASPSATAAGKCPLGF